MVETIIVLSSIVGLWLLIVFSISIIILVCRRRIKRKKHSINVICAQKYDLLVSLCELMKENGIELYGANKNPTQKRWTNSPKVYAHLYIDDAALGCPLKMDLSISDRPFVDWEAVSRLLKDNGILY